MDNGELLVGLTGTGQVRKSAIAVSSGYASGGTLTFTTVLTANDYEQVFDLAWGFGGSGATYAVSAYDQKAVGSRSAVQMAWLTEDYGLTWTPVADIGTGSPGDAHIHNVCYDAYRDAIWMATGDGVGSSAIRVSWDKGANWTVVSTKHQPTTIFPFPNCVVFGSDGTPNGILRIDNPSPSSLVVKQAYELNKYVHPATGARTISHVARGPFRAAADGSPLLMPFTVAVAGNDSIRGLVLSTPDGYTLSELWRDSRTYTASGRGPMWAVGPTADGHYLIGGTDDSASGWFTVVLDAPTPSVTSAISGASANLARAIPRRAYLAMPAAGSQTIAVADGWKEIEVAASAWASDDVGGLFSLAPDGAGVIANRACIARVEVDSALAWQATGAMTGISVNGVRAADTYGRVFSRTITIKAGQRICGVAYVTNSTAVNVTPITYHLILDAWETY
jgi:hypothetical protein